jgi:hypothetical protein
MVTGLLWIVGLYAAAVVFAHWMSRRRSGSAHHHYVLVAGNHQMQIEGYIRALQQYSRRTGTDIGITVVLDRSSDDTGAIMERLARGSSGIDWIRRDGERELAREWEFDGLDARRKKQVVWVELDRADDLARLPI